MLLVYQVCKLQVNFTPAQKVDMVNLNVISSVDVLGYG